MSICLSDLLYIEVGVLVSVVPICNKPFLSMRVKGRREIIPKLRGGLKFILLPKIGAVLSCPVWFHLFDMYISNLLAIINLLFSTAFYFHTA